MHTTTAVQPAPGLRNIESRDYESTARFAVVPHHGLNITGRYTDVNKTGMTTSAWGPNQMVRISSDLT